MSARTRCPAFWRASSDVAARNWVKHSSGNLASTTRPRSSPGSRTRQSGRVRFESVAWNS